MREKKKEEETGTVDRGPILEDVKCHAKEFRLYAACSREILWFFKNQSLHFRQFSLARRLFRKSRKRE